MMTTFWSARYLPMASTWQRVQRIRRSSCTRSYRTATRLCWMSSRLWKGISDGSGTVSFPVTRRTWFHAVLMPPLSSGMWKKLNWSRLLKDIRKELSVLLWMILPRSACDLLCVCFSIFREFTDLEVSIKINNNKARRILWYVKISQYDPKTTNIEIFGKDLSASVIESWLFQHQRTWNRIRLKKTSWFSLWTLKRSKNHTYYEIHFIKHAMCDW